MIHKHSLSGIMRADTRTRPGFGDQGGRENVPRDMHLPPGQAAFTGAKTMRRLAEPVQRHIEDTDPVSLDVPGGFGPVIDELERQAAELEQQRRMAERGEDEPMDAADDVDNMYLRSVLETDPEKVIRALVEFLRGRRK